MAAAVWTMVVGLGFSNGIARAAFKVPLNQVFSMNCQGVSLGERTGNFGYAIINKTAGGTLTAEVVLRGADPNTTYDVRLVQTPSGSDCNILEGKITTDSRGNGNAHINETLLSGTTGAFVLVNTDVDFFFSPDVVFN